MRRVRVYLPRELSNDPAFSDGTFDGRFDDLWQRASSAYPVIGHCSSDFLRWRYTQCPLVKYRVLAALDQHQDRLLGYVVCFSSNPREITIADILADRQEHSLPDLLAQFILGARANSIHAIYCSLLGASRLQEILARFGFRPDPPVAFPFGR